MCGKVEANIPEDDPRNPAVIADLVGDNVGDCAGSMADVFESIAAEVIGTMILGAALAHEAKLDNPEPWIFFPLIVHALDLVISSVGIMLTIPTSDKEDPLDTMKRAYGVCMGLAAFGFMATCWFLLSTPVAPQAWWYFTLCGWIGICMSFCIIRSTQYYTDAAYAPVKRIAAASQTGSGTNVIAGISVGLESTCFPTLVIAFALIAAFTLGKMSGLPGNTAGVFGTAVATMGMLCTAVFVLSMNNFGPIADNAGGIVEMSAQPHEVRVITDRLDSVGNVTKAASKGYAVGGSALSCFVLFQAFLDEISSYSGVPFDTVNIAKVEVVCGGLLGMMMIFLFSGWSMQSVGATAQKVVWEVRRQFKSRPGIMDGTEKPDYRACVAIVTSEALKEMVWPALLALLLPICVGFGFKWFGQYTGRPNLGVEVVAGFMMMATLAGLLMAMFMDNAGGAWVSVEKGSAAAASVARISN
jgi:H(+)-translocating pyrophosphatase